MNCLTVTLGAGLIALALAGCAGPRTLTPVAAATADLDCTQKTGSRTQKNCHPKLRFADRRSVPANLPGAFVGSEPPINNLGAPTLAVCFGGLSSC